MSSEERELRASLEAEREAVQCFLFTVIDQVPGMPLILIQL